MKFSDFILKWQGRYIDFDGYYGNQCMDLLHQYCVEVLGITDGRVLAAPGAKHIFLNFDTIFGREHFDKITNTPNGIPKNGDIMIWGSGTWGHVAMYIDGNVNSFKSFDQNYPTGTPCHIQDHRYNNVLGWLRYKGSPPQEDMQAILDEMRGDRDRNWNLYQEELRIKEELKAEIVELKKSDEGYQEFIREMARILDCEPNTEKIIGKANGLTTVEDQKNDALKELTKAQETLKSTTEQLQEKEKELTKLTSQYRGTLDELKTCQNNSKELEMANKIAIDHMQEQLEKIEELEKIQPVKELTTSELLKALIDKIFKK